MNGVSRIPVLSTGRPHSDAAQQFAATPQRQKPAMRARGIASNGFSAPPRSSSVVPLTPTMADIHTQPEPHFHLQWEDRALAYVVREPFVSKSSSASIVAGLLTADESLTVESLMGPEGTIFSDGIETDFLPFSEGVIATISVAQERAHLVVG